MIRPIVDYRLYLVTDRAVLGKKDLYQSVEMAIRGGVTLVQLREKEISTRGFLKAAVAMKKITDSYRIPLIINDRLDIALAADVHGLHIGQEDMPVEIARGLLGADKIIGVSVSTLNEALIAQAQGADYLGVGAIYSTSTKPEAQAVGLEQLARIKRSVHIPVVGIGGIDEGNLMATMATGIDGASVVSAILAKDDPEEGARKLRNIIDL